MESVVSVLIFSVGLLYFLYLDYFLWVKPDRYMRDIYERRVKMKSLFRFLPDWFIGFIFFYEQPQLSVWWARVAIVIGTLICAMGVIASIHGSF